MYCSLKFKDYKSGASLTSVRGGIVILQGTGFFDSVKTDDERQTTGMRLDT